MIYTILNAYQNTKNKMDEVISKVDKDIRKTANNSSMVTKILWFISGFVAMLALEVPFVILLKPTYTVLIPYIAISLIIKIIYAYMYIKFIINDS